jgi:hypothetical protein
MKESFSEEHQHTSFPVFLILSYTSSYGNVPVTRTSWVAKVTVKSETPPENKNMWSELSEDSRATELDVPSFFALSRTRVTAPEQPEQVICRRKDRVALQCCKYLLVLNLAATLTSNLYCFAGSWIESWTSVSLPEVSAIYDDNVCWCNKNPAYVKCRGTHSKTGNWIP